MVRPPAPRAAAADLITKVLWWTNCTKIGVVSGRATSAYTGWPQGRARNIVTDQKNKPVLDEQSFEKLLEAAYVIQKHNRKMRELEESLEAQSERLREQESADQAPPPRNKLESEETQRSNSDYTFTLAEIVEAQHQIQMRHLELDKAMAVVAERVARITGASGAAIGILEGQTLRYRAASGAPALPVGSELALDAAICCTSVRTGQVIRTGDVNTEFLFDPEPCRQRGILSLVAVPIYREDDIVGALELYFDRIHGFAEQDIHTCQLMAGLVTEAMGRDAGLALKKSMAAERSTMLAAIERLQPNLAAWAEDQPAAGAAAVAKSACWKCGTKLVAEEQFCGECGAPRASDGGPSSMQSKLASAWQLQQTNQESFAAAPRNGTSPPRETVRPVPAHLNLNEAEVEEDRSEDKPIEPFTLPEWQQSAPLTAPSFTEHANEDAKVASLSLELQLDEEEEDSVETPSTTLIKPQQEDVVWSSAARARDFLESLSETRTPSALARFWRSRRGDFYLAVAVIMVAVVIRWGIWSNHSVGATGGRTAVSGSANRGKLPAPDADLSAFDKLLIGLGLAEAPETPEYKGNPDTQVWVDLHTAQYYCPGSDLYGKTPQGKLTSQRDAQSDQFEPASRKACD
jgi:putative methionine-R-sulfoxide reductase with GAF domain